MLLVSVTNIYWNLFPFDAKRDIVEILFARRYLLTIHTLYHIDHNTTIELSDRIYLEKSERTEKSDNSSSGHNSPVNDLKEVNMLNCLGPSLQSFSFKCPFIFSSNLSHSTLFNSCTSC